MATIGVDDVSLQVDSQPKSVDLGWGLAAAWHSIQSTGYIQRTTVIDTAEIIQLIKPTSSAMTHFEMAYCCACYTDTWSCNNKFKI